MRFEVPAVVRPDADAVTFIVGTATTGRHWISHLDLSRTDSDEAVGAESEHLSHTYDEMRRIAGVTFEISPQRAGHLAGDPTCGRVPVDPSIVRALERMADMAPPGALGSTDAPIEAGFAVSPDGLVARVIYLDRDAQQPVGGLFIGTTRHTREEWARDIPAATDCSLTPHEGVGDEALLRECPTPPRVAIHFFVEASGLSATAFAQAPAESDSEMADLSTIAEAIAQAYLIDVCEGCAPPSA
jgi:hypothetical protein